MEPQDRAPEFFEQRVQPVAPPDVDELVRDHRALNTERHLQDASRQQNERARHADGGRRLHSVADGDRRVRDNSAQTQEAGREPEQPDEDAAGNDIYT